MISDPKNLTEQLQNLSERIAIEMRALNRTKVSKINGAIPDNNGEVTIANATTSASGLMSASDKTKLGGIAEGANNYSLPTASSSQLGGVKTGSNITNTSGTISVSKKNVTDALGFTPLQNAPVSSVNGQTGDVNIDVGVKTVNGTAPDASGNVTIEVGSGGGTGDGIPKTGNRGVLAGYEMFGGEDATNPTIITKESPDFVILGSFEEPVSVNLPNSDENAFWVKMALFVHTDPAIGLPEFTFNFGGNWVWQSSQAPTLGEGEYLGYFALVFVWAGGFGFVIPVKLIAESY